jgi:squalene-associated FAD-dependent desaturase
MADVARRVAIVGAGWAGLAAAVTLAERGILVSVFEASRHLGGRARRVEIEGMHLDNGQHILIGAYAETLRLMRAVGADPDRLFLRLPLELRMADGFHFRAAELPAPFHLVVGLLRSPGLRLRERYAALRLIAAHRRVGYRLAKDEPVASWLDRHRQPQRLCAALWHPLCTAALNTPPARASAQVFLNVLRDTIEGDRYASHLLLPRGDLGELFPLPASKFIQARGGAIHLGAAVRSIAQTADGWQLNDLPDRYGQVILACAPQHTAALLGMLPGLAPLVESVERLAYEPIYTCYLQYPNAAALPSPMLGFSDGLAQWAFDRGVLSGHPGLIACVISGAGQHEDLSGPQLAAALHGELASAVLGLPEPLWSRVIAEKRATFSCVPGLVRPGNRTPLDGLALAGDYTASDHPATLETAMRSGVDAAHAVMASTATAARP